MDQPIGGEPWAVVGIIPYDDTLGKRHPWENDFLFDPKNTRNRDDVFRHWRVLRERAAKRSIDIHTLDLIERPDAVVSVDRLLSDPPAPWFLYIGEPQVVRPDLYRNFDRLRQRTARIFTHSIEFASIADNVRHFSYPQTFPLSALQHQYPEDRGLLVMINANKQPAFRKRELYSARAKVAAALVPGGAIDVYGPGWDSSLKVVARLAKRTLGSLANTEKLASGKASQGIEDLGETIRSGLNFGIGTVLNHRRVRRVAKVWKGVVGSKYETLARYDFCLAFENAVSRGYISEKIFDPMAVGCIPIYLGDPSISDVLPAETFIDFRMFESPEEMLDTLQSMSVAEKRDRRGAMRAYLLSESFAKRFSVDAWVSQLLDELEFVLRLKDPPFDC